MKNAPNSKMIARDNLLVQNKKGDTLGSLYCVPLEPPMLKVVIIGIKLLTFLGWKTTYTQQKLLAPPKELPEIPELTDLTPALKLPPTPVIPPKKIYTRDIPGTASLK